MLAAVLTYSMMNLPMVSIDYVIVYPVVLYVVLPIWLLRRYGQLRLFVIRKYVEKKILRNWRGARASVLGLLDSDFSTICSTASCVGFCSQLQLQNLILTVLISYCSLCSSQLFNSCSSTTHANNALDIRLLVSFSSYNKQSLLSALLATRWISCIIDHLTHYLNYLLAYLDEQLAIIYMLSELKVWAF